MANWKSCKDNTHCVFKEDRHNSNSFGFSCDLCSRVICKKCSSAEAQEIRGQTKTLTHLCSDCVLDVRQLPKIFKLVDCLKSEVTHLKNKISKLETKIKQPDVDPRIAKIEDDIAILNTKLESKQNQKKANNNLAQDINSNNRVPKDIDFTIQTIERHLQYQNDQLAIKLDSVIELVKFFTDNNVQNQNKYQPQKKAILTTVASMPSFGSAVMTTTSDGIRGTSNTKTKLATAEERLWYNVGNFDESSTKQAVKKHLAANGIQALSWGKLPGVNFMKLDDIDVKVTGENVPPAITSFESSGLRPYLLENVKKSGYTKPTPIQKYAIPIIMSGRDLMGCAQTGSGKTAAFLLPIINKILASQEPPVREGNTTQPNVIIVSPTRELAIQIYEQAKKFAYGSIVKTAVAYGGTSVNHQRNIVMAGCHILVATPGRLNDFVNHGHISFASVQFFVLDEADRMLDMGFLPTVEQMLGHASMTATGERQTLMFSATFPEEIQHLAGKFLHNYVFVAVGIVGSASSDVEQNFYQVTRFEKRNKLMEMLKQSKERTVVFVETKRNADFLATLLSENDIQSTSIHGDRLQREREQALWDFKKGIRNILVATGVAARGLDIEGIQHVINYDLPKSIDEYVHRIGRTGRVGNRGKASSFYDSSNDAAIAGQLANILKQAGQEVPDFLSSGGYGGGGESDNFGGRDIRGDDFGQGQNFNQQPAEVADEEW